MGNNGSSLEGSRTLYISVFFFFEKKYISVLSLHYTARLLGDFGPDESMGPLIGGFIFDCWIQVPSVVNQPFG